jgi:hypothetical protein
VSLVPMYYEALYNLRDACRELQDYRAAAEFERILSRLPRDIEYPIRPINID